jgi:hypothetical protein
MGPDITLRYPFKVTRGLLYIKPPMLLCITWGMGSGNLDFFGSQMAFAYRLDAISQGPKKSRAQPLPLALIMDAARIKSITHGAV